MTSRKGWGIVAAEDGARRDLAAAVGLREEVSEGDDGAVFGPEDVGDVHAVVGDGDVEVHEALILGRADQRDDREEADVVRREARVATRVAVVRLVHQLAVFDHHEAVAVGDALEEVRRARQIRRVEAVRLGEGARQGAIPGPRPRSGATPRPGATDAGHRQPRGATPSRPVPRGRARSIAWFASPSPARRP